MKKLLFKKYIIIPALAAVVFLTTTAFKNDFFEIAKQLEIFTTLYKEINMNYVDDTNPGALMDTAIKNMLVELDPYTNFMNEQDVEEARINNTGDYTGIGAKVKTMKDKLLIIEPYKGYPADQAGLKAGDEIIKVGSITVSNYKDDAGNLLKGSTGSEVKVTFMRQGKEQIATIKRADVEINAVPYFSMLDSKTGYIVLSQFTDKAYSQTNYALRDLKAQGAKRIILDLRGNPGGLLNEAIRIVNLFVPKGQLVVTTKSKVQKYNRTYYTQSEPIDTEIPLAILINGNSASASEIVSGALQDLDRAVIIGSRSFGKGLVQRPKSLPYGTQLKITISRYYTPSGRCIQALDYWHRNENGEAIRVKQENYNEFKTKNGRNVYDGGGVLPEVIIGPNKKSPITTAIIKNDFVFNFATRYYYNHKVENLSAFQLTDADFKDFKDYLKASNFSFETDTEKELDEVYKTAQEENLDEAIVKDYNALVEKLKQVKISNIDDDKDFLIQALTKEIVKRYGYSEGLYDYYKRHDPAVKKANDIVSDISVYYDYLR